MQVDLTSPIMRSLYIQSLKNTQNIKILNIKCVCIFKENTDNSHYRLQILCKCKGKGTKLSTYLSKYTMKMYLN
jgi:hypothetical protein